MSLTRLTGLIGLTFALLLNGGCVSINTQHPDIAEAPGPGVANVYFIRTTPVFIHPFADDTVTVEFNGKELLKLDEGVYALVYLKPSKGILKISNLSLFTNRKQSQRVWKESQYRFIAGRTYFIHIVQEDEEFRGIFYSAEIVSLAEAKRLAKTVKRIGGPANEHPIEDITDVYEAPKSAGKKDGPSLPEQLYRREDYMLKEKK